MKLTLAITFDIDPAAWQAEYDLPTVDAATADITDVLRRNAEDGSIAQALLEQWPMMRDAATVTVAPPGRVLAAMDWTQALARTEVAALTETTGGVPVLLTDALREHKVDDVNAELVDVVRRAVAEAGYDSTDPQAVAVVFTATEWENGYFLDESAQVYFADGSTDSIDLHGTNELLNPDGACGADAALGINLRTGEVEYDDHEMNVLDMLRLPYKSVL